MPELENNHERAIRYAIYENGISHVKGDEIDIGKKFAESLETKRSRICFHRNSNDSIHEMMITFHKDTYVRPHKHFSKTESYLVIDGEVEIVFFDDEGCIKKRVPMGTYASGKNFYLKSISEEWHTVLIKTDFATILEITNGPFVANDCVFAEWAPKPSDTIRANAYIQSLL